MADPTTLTMLKCPFCGKDATLEKDISLFGNKGIRVDWSIECENCHKADGGNAHSTWYEITDEETLEKVNPTKDDDMPDGRTKVITAWNKRATSETDTNPAEDTGTEQGKDSTSTGEQSNPGSSSEQENNAPSGEGTG